MDTRGSRKIVVESPATKIVFDEPLGAQVNDVVDMGWAIFDACYKGACFHLGPTPGSWTEDAGEDEGISTYAAAGPPILWHKDTKIQTPATDFRVQRRLVL